MFSSPDIVERDRRTAEAFAAPQVGDRFEEFYSFWMFVVAVEPDGRVAVLTASGPCTLPRDGKLKVYPSHDAYRAAWSYGTIPGYTVALADRSNKVAGWFTGWPEPEPEPEPTPVERSDADEVARLRAEITHFRDEWTIEGDSTWLWLTRILDGQQGCAVHAVADGGVADA